MHIATIRIRNFRVLKDVEIPLARATVLIGENNTGKSSVLDCISLTLGRRWGQRGTGFSEYDVTVDNGAAANDASQIMDSGPGKPPDADAGPAEKQAGSSGADVSKEAPEASIELFFTEKTAGEWPELRLRAGFSVSSRPTR